jgi:hypothetical protein
MNTQPPWFRVRVGKNTVIVRKELDGCGIRIGFTCFHGNNTLYQLLWELANKKSMEQIKKKVISEYDITAEEFDTAIKETNRMLKDLGLLTKNLENTVFELLKVKEGSL